MAVQDIQQNYVFPRIPLNLTVPDNYPDIGRVSNISIVPEVKEFKFTRDELELWGSYLVTVSYFKNQPATEFVVHKPCDQFFSMLKVRSDGMFAECEDDYTSGYKENSRELYTAHFTRAFHTFVDLEFISKPRSFRPSIVVEKADIDRADERTLKGEVVLGLTNRFRRNIW